MLGFVSSLCRFARFLEEHRLDPPGFRGILCAAEPLGEAHRALIQDYLGGPAFNTYGSREFMSMAAECDSHDGLHIHAENILAETADPAGAEPSEIVITDLHNYGTVFLRYAIGDLGIMTTGMCSCGRGLPRLMQITGRSGEILKLANGLELSHLVWYHTLKEAGEIREFQVLQPKKSKVLLRLVTAGGLTSESRALIVREFTRLLGAGTEFLIEEVPEIPLSAVGKLRRVVPWEKMPAAERER
jgi:phenylacetate-CoA ligase